LLIIKASAAAYLLTTQADEALWRDGLSAEKEETTMRKTVLTALGAALIAVATTQLASAHEQHHARKVEQFRNAHNAVVVVQPSTPEIYSGGWSAPAGR
jgi:uncharacterized membrane protein